MSSSMEVTRDQVFGSLSTLHADLVAEKERLNSIPFDLSAIWALINKLKRRDDDTDDSIADDPEYFELHSNDEIITRCKGLMSDKRWSKAEKLLFMYLGKLDKGCQFLSIHHPGLLSEYYQTMSRKDANRLIECFFMLAKTAYFQEYNPDKVLPWLQEFDAILKNQWYTKPLSLEHEWAHSEWIFQEHGEQPFRRFLQLFMTAKTFKRLQNTAAYSYYIVISLCSLVAVPPEMVPRLFSVISDDFSALKHLRHPDPTFNPEFRINWPTLQVQGSWKRLAVKANDALGPRHNGSSFIWKGYFYIIGGVKTRVISEEEDPARDIDVWRLNLSKLKEWEFVSKCPTTLTGGHSLGANRSMRVYKGKLYLFSGHPRLLCFDLKTNKWSALKTIYRATAADRAAGLDIDWPWPFKMGCKGFCLEIVDDRLLVFGGISFWNVGGCNLFMELSLKTLLWRRISGYPTIQQHNDPHLPGPRHLAASWIGKDKRFYLFSGLCEKRKLTGEMFEKLWPYHPSEPWNYDDMWSCDVKTGIWRRERLSGNPPSPRADMACDYNEKLDAVIIFAGNNQICPSQIDDTDRVMNVSFYADTFIYTPQRAAPLLAVEGNTTAACEKIYQWKQVMTCGFPSYRASAQLACDPETGRTYLYGGEVRSELLPNKTRTAEQAMKRAEPPLALMKMAARQGYSAETLGEAAQPSISHIFADLWQLDLDIPGGDFSWVDLEDEARTASVGPWQRCFSCQNFGFFKKCGGKSFFSYYRLLFRFS